ncbi:hypothetical protein ACHAPX_010299 [Trichoderma viride]
MTGYSEQKRLLKEKSASRNRNLRSGLDYLGRQRDNPDGSQVLHAATTTLNRETQSLRSWDGTRPHILRECNSHRQHRPARLLSVKCSKLPQSVKKFRENRKEKCGTTKPNAYNAYIRLAKDQYRQYLEEGNDSKVPDDSVIGRTNLDGTVPTCSQIHDASTVATSVTAHQEQTITGKPKRKARRSRGKKNSARAASAAQNRPLNSAAIPDPSNAKIGLKERQAENNTTKTGKKNDAGKG